ncbi:hypothetical protein OV203_00720 [Nannocystis sp. ILAH1]|uniref:hypothetical protein n=1 Tax=Nannocystis sp. ILAH1 TaxID=2996789 RepID=UPI00226FAD6A|nr:hypothetical protein [Nannocystis sp. ILAH1]MCY0985632.1 hypothetical protein [Nannocystis sp. ILAH1]
MTHAAAQLGAAIVAYVGGAERGEAMRVASALLLREASPATVRPRLFGMAKVDAAIAAQAANLRAEKAKRARGEPAPVQALRCAELTRG